MVFIFGMNTYSTFWYSYLVWMHIAHFGKENIFRNSCQIFSLGLFLQTFISAPTFPGFTQEAFLTASFKHEEFLLAFYILHAIYSDLRCVYADFAQFSKHQYCQIKFPWFFLLINVCI